MLDQATQLRHLVLQTTRDAAADRVRPPRLLVVGGGNSGVGVTTLAVNVARVLSERGTRIVLVDADVYRPQVALHYGMPQPRGVADVLAARLEIRDVLQQGPGGIRVAAGTHRRETSADYDVAAQGRLLRQLRTLGSDTDLVILDTGGGSSDVVRRFWQAADEILLVTTPDSVAVMDCYAILKRLAAAGDQHPVRLIVNKAANRSVADDVHRRMDRSCRRFLGLEVELLGHVPIRAAPQADSAGGNVVPGPALPNFGSCDLEPIITGLATGPHPSAGSNGCAPRSHENAKKARVSAQPGTEPLPILDQAVPMPPEVNLERIDRL